VSEEANETSIPLEREQPGMPDQAGFERITQSRRRSLVALGGAALAVSPFFAWVNVFLLGHLNLFQLLKAGGHSETLAVVAMLVGAAAVIAAWTVEDSGGLRAIAITIGLISGLVAGVALSGLINDVRTTSGFAHVSFGPWCAFLGCGAMVLGGLLGDAPWSAPKAATNSVSRGGSGDDAGDPVIADREPSPTVAGDAPMASSDEPDGAEDHTDAQAAETVMSAGDPSESEGGEDESDMSGEGGSLNDLERIRELRDAGILTPGEAEEQKHQILKRDAEAVDSRKENRDSRQQSNEPHDGDPSAVSGGGRSRRGTYLWLGVIAAVGLGVVALVVALSSSGSSSPSRQSNSVSNSSSQAAGSSSTEQRLLQPFTTTGLEPGLSVSQRITASCSTTTLTDFTRPNTYRCFPDSSSAFIQDPCFPDPLGNQPYLACFESPWSTAVTEVVPNAGLPKSSSNPSAPPWGLELADGSRCTFEAGATGTIGRERLNYSCTGGANVYGSPDTSTDPWTVMVQRPGETSLAQAEVQSSWR
jgi:hypothetical protein